MFLFVSNTLGEFLDKFEKAPARLETYVSAAVLLDTADKQPALMDKCKSFLLLSVAFIVC